MYSKSASALMSVLGHLFFIPTWLFMRKLLKIWNAFDDHISTIESGANKINGDGFHSFSKKSVVIAIKFGYQFLTPTLVFATRIKAFNHLAVAAIISSKCCHWKGAHKVDTGWNWCKVHFTTIIVAIEISNFIQRPIQNLWFQAEFPGVSSQI